MKKELSILDKARKAGLMVQTVTFRGRDGKRDRRKGYDLIDPITGHIQYTFEPINTGIYNKGYLTQKWMIHTNNEGGPKYVVRLRVNAVDLSKRELTGFISTPIKERAIV